MKNTKSKCQRAFKQRPRKTVKKEQKTRGKKFKKKKKSRYTHIDKKKKVSGDSSPASFQK